MTDTQENNFFDLNNEDPEKFLMDSQINLENFSNQNQDSVIENDPFFDVISPINPSYKFKKKQKIPSNENSEDYEFLFERDNNKNNTDINIFKKNNKLPLRKISEISSIPFNNSISKRGSNLIFGGDITPFHKLSMKTEDLSNNQPSKSAISQEQLDQNVIHQPLQNISFRNFSAQSKEFSIPDNNNNSNNKKKSNIKDLINIVIKKSGIFDEQKNKEREHHKGLDNYINDGSDGKVSNDFIRSIDNQEEEKIDEFQLDTSMVDIQSTMNIDTAFEFYESKKGLQKDNTSSLKKLIPNESLQKLSLFQKNSTANMFEHYQPAQEESNIFKHSMEHIENKIDENDSFNNNLSRQSSQWNLSHINLQNESFVIEEDIGIKNNRNELTEEYQILLDKRNKIRIEETLDHSPTNFVKKDSIQSIDLKKSSLAKKIARQSRKQHPIVIIKDTSLNKSTHTIHTVKSNSNYTNSHDRQKLNLKSKLKSSMVCSTKKSLHSRKPEHDIINKRSLHSSQSKLDKGLGSGSIKTKGSFKTQLGNTPLNYSLTDTSKSQSKLISNFKNKDIIKLNQPMISQKKPDKLNSKMSQPNLKINNNTINKGEFMRRSNTQKKNQINKDIVQNKTEEILKNKTETNIKKYSQLKLKLSKKMTLMKNKSICSNSKTSTGNKIYSVDKILNANTSSQNFENIYNKEIIEQQSKESHKSKSEHFKSDSKTKMIDQFYFDSKNSPTDSFINETHSPIALNIISPKMNNTQEPFQDKISSYRESAKSSNTKFIKQTTHNSTFLPFPRSVSIKANENLTYKSMKDKPGVSREGTSESHVEGIHTDAITFTEGEDDYSQLEGLKDNKKDLHAKVPDEYGIISDDESNKNEHLDMNSNNLSNSFNKINNSNKSEPTFKSKKKDIMKNLNKSSKVNSNNPNKLSNESLNFNNQISLQKKYKNYFKNFEILKNQDKSLTLPESKINFSNKNSTNYINQNNNQKKDSFKKLEIPKKSNISISKSGKLLTNKKSNHKFSKKSSVHMKNHSTFTKHILPIPNYQFNKVILNLTEKFPKKKKTRYSLHQVSKNKLNDRHKTIDKKNPQPNQKMDFNLSFSKPFNTHKQSSDSFNQSSLLGKTFESDVMSNFKQHNTKNFAKNKYNSKLKSIRQETFKSKSNFDKVIQIKKEIKKRQKNYQMNENKYSHKKFNASLTHLDSVSNNEITINNMEIKSSKNSNYISRENNISLSKNTQSNNISKKNISRNSQKNFINIGKVNINNLVNNQETHNYIFFQPKDYSYPHQTPSIIDPFRNSQNLIDSQKFLPMNVIYNKKDSGDYKETYNSFENIKDSFNSDKNNFSQEEIQSKDFEIKNKYQGLLSNDPTKIMNSYINSSEEVLDFIDPPKMVNNNQQYNSMNFGILSKSLNLKNCLPSKVSLDNSKKTSQRDSVINSNKDFEKKEFNLRKRIKQMKSTRRFTIDKISKNKSHKELKKQYKLIKKNTLDKSSSKKLDTNKSIFFNKYTQPEQIDSIYQRLSSNIDHKPFKKNKFEFPSKNNDLNTKNYNSFNKSLSIPKQQSKRTSLKISSISKNNTKRKTSLEGVLKKHSMTLTLNKQKLQDSIKTKIKGIYHLSKNFKRNNQNNLKKKINQNSLNDTTSINSITQIEQKINKGLAPLKNINHKFLNDKLIEGGSVDHESSSHKNFKFENSLNFKNIKSVKQYKTSRKINKDLFPSNIKKFVNIKDSLLKKKLIKPNKVKKDKYYCSSNINNSDFAEYKGKEDAKNRIFKSSIFSSNKLKPKLSKISLNKNCSKHKIEFLNKKIFSFKSISKISSNNFGDIINVDSSKLKYINSSTSKPTPLRYTYSNQSYSLRDSNQKQREGFFSINSNEHQSNINETPSSSDNLTNLSINSQTKSKVSDVNIYNPKNYSVNTSGSNCGIIYKEKNKLKTKLKKIKKFKIKSNNENNEIKLSKVIQKNSND